MSLDAGQPHSDPADHGGGLDAARRRFGGARADWIDLSTGINPLPFPLPDLPADCWTALPDQGAYDDLLAAARQVWRVPDAAAIVAAPGTSASTSRAVRWRSAPCHLQWADRRSS